MALERVREAGQGAGFAMAALGVAVAPWAGWRPFPAVFALAMALVGTLAMAWAAGARPGVGWPRGGETWPRERALGFFGGSALFLAAFLAAGSAAGAATAGPGAGDLAADWEEAAVRTHTYTVEGGPVAPTAAGPTWIVPAAAQRVEGLLRWDPEEGPARIHATLEVDGPGGWARAGQWELRSGDAFNATLDPGTTGLRLSLRAAEGGGTVHAAASLRLLTPA